MNLLGFNYRMNELQAAIGTLQVGRLDGFLKKRKENHDTISKMLEPIEEVRQFETSHGDFQSSYYCKAIVLQGGLETKRIEIIEALKTHGIGTSIYYPRPVPDLTYYRKKYGYVHEQFPEAARIAYHSIALPVGPHLGPGDAQYIAEAVNAVLGKMS